MTLLTCPAHLADVARKLRLIYLGMVCHLDGRGVCVFEMGTGATITVTATRDHEADAAALEEDYINARDTR